MTFLSEELLGQTFGFHKNLQGRRTIKQNFLTPDEFQVTLGQYFPSPGGQMLQLLYSAVEVPQLAATLRLSMRGTKQFVRFVGGWDVE